ncbi:MAG: LytR/AlgR family response regulator transcription factor [Clostridiaceae bacterium]
MLKVFVCEDRAEYRDRITKIIENVLLIENLDIKFELSTDNPYEIIERVEVINERGIYFFDVDLNTDINGIQLAEKVRELDPRGFIIFVTTHAEMSLLTFTYRIEAMDYIIKDNPSEVRNRVHQCILKANKRHISENKETSKVFIIKSEDKIINVEYSNILFFETSDTIHKVKLHAINRQVEFYAKMKDIEGILDDTFVRCHNSFIVNKKNIKEIDKSKRVVHMVNGESCLCSTRGIKLVSL